MSSSEEIQEQIAELRAEHNRLTTAVTLRHKQTDLQTLESDLNNLAKAAQKLTQGGYPNGAALSGHVQTLTAQLAQVRTTFTQVLNAASTRLQAELGQANLGIGGALGGQVSLLASATEALETLSGRVEIAEEQLDAVLEPISDATNTLESLFRTLTWSQEQWNDFSGDRNASGGLLAACEAEWKQTGRGADDPDGVLYLTDKALIFEQKEKKGKTFGMFGGKMVQEVEWSIPLGHITDVRAKNEGMLGGRDILFLTISGGDPAPEVKIEVKGSADNKAWVGYLNNAKQGTSLVDMPQITSAEVDMSEWTGAMPSAPAASMNLAGLGGALAGMAAGASAAQSQKAMENATDAAKSLFAGKKSEAADDAVKGSANAMKGMAQSGSTSDDDGDAVKGSANAMKGMAQSGSTSDDGGDHVKGWPKEGDKPSGNVSGGPKGGEKQG